jgi:ribosomal protein S1
MKKLALLLAVVCAVGFASADETKAPTADTQKTPAKVHQHKTHATKSHDVPAEIVSVDATAKTVTVKGDKENKTLPVDDKAIASIKDLKAGQKVTLVCRDDEKGNHVAVTGVKADVKMESKVPTAAPSPLPKP